MAHIGIVLALVVVLATPTNGLAQRAPTQPVPTQPAPKAATGSPSPSGASPLQQWEGEVVALDPSIGLACVSFPDGRVIKFRASAETLKAYKIGDKVKGKFLRPRAEDAVRSVTGAPTPPCPLPPALKMTYERWTKDTAVTVSRRSDKLRAVDQALKAYWDAKDETQRGTLRPAVKTAFDAWKAEAKQGSEWEVRNRSGAPEILDAELSAKETAGLQPDEAKAWALVMQHHEEALAEMFKGQKFVLKNTSVLKAVLDAHEQFKAAREVNGSHLPLDPLDSTKLATEAIDAVIGPAKDKLLNDFTELKEKLTDLAVHSVPILGKLGGPWGALVKEWKETAQAAWDLRKARKAQGAFAPGNPSAALDAMLKDLADDVKKEATKAAVATVFGVSKIATATVPIAPQAISVAEALARVLFELKELAEDAEDATKANALIEQGKLDANLFEASPLLAAYYLADSDTSAVIFLARPFGAPGFVRETEEMVKKARPVLDKAKEKVLSASYEIPALRHMKGGTLDRTETKFKVPTGRVAGAKQDVKDAVLNPQSAGPLPTTREVTPDDATPLIFANRWLEWTEVARRPRSRELKAVDEAVKVWGGGQNDREALDGVRIALAAWQAKEGSAWAQSSRNGKFAISALDARTGASRPSICPLTPADCNGPWNERPRDPSWPACADPPKLGCKQIVLGRLDDIKQYVGCPGYVTLDLYNWTPGANDRFVACAAAGRLGATCNPPIFIGSGSANIAAASIVSQQLSQLKSCGCTMTVNALTKGFALACPDGLHGPVACPVAPRSCAGPWQNQAPFPGQPRPADYPPCAAPPWNGSKQVVLGRHDDIKKYIGCPGYVALNVSDWTPEKNDDFVACAVAGKLVDPKETANPPILIASGWDNISPENITFRELTQLRMCKCDMEVGEHGQGGVNRCPPPVSASLPGLAQLFPRRACGGAPVIPSGWQLLVDLVQRGPAVLAGIAR